MGDFSQAFEDRLQEIEAYLDLLESLEKQVQTGTPRIGGKKDGATIRRRSKRFLRKPI